MHVPSSGIGEFDVESESSIYSATAAFLPRGLPLMITDSLLDLDLDLWSPFVWPLRQTSQTKRSHRNMNHTRPFHVNVTLVDRDKLCTINLVYYGFF